MSNFIKFRKGECPICQGAEKRCNYVELISNTGYISRLIFCKGTTNDPNYAHRGYAQQTGIGMWSYVPDTENWKDSQNIYVSQEQYLAEKRKREQEEEKRKREKISNSLSLETRDKEIRKLINQLELKEDQKKQLLGRGLTAAQIEKNGYRSVNQWQKFSHPVDSRLAGVSINGNKLNNPDSGILCPVINADGLFVGLRINNDNFKLREIGKYTWVSSSGRGIDNKIPVSDIDEEWPIAVHHPSNQKFPQILFICEGMEYKSAIAAEKLNATVIGFSGNDFTSNTRLLEQIIKARQREIKSKVQLRILPDSGINAQVASSYLKAIEYFKNQNLKIAYWGQAYEKGQDIDEIPLGTKIEYLSPKEAIKVIEPLKDSGFHKWLELRKFSPDIQVEERYINSIPKPETDTITFIKSGLGTGKTTFLKKWLKNDLTNYGAFALGCRNTLLHHFCESTGFYHIHEDDFSNMRFDPQGQFALCVDSLLKFQPEDFDNKILILDEVKSIIPHLLTSSTIPKHLRNRIINLFQEAINRADRVICLDGNLTDWVVEFLKQTAPGKAIVRLENVFRKARQLISYRGSITKKGKINNRDRTGIISQMLTATRPAIVADSQKQCEQLDELLTNFGYDVLRIDSSTSGEDYAKEFLANPDAYLEKYQPDALILSPSAESGIDISIKGFFSDLFILAFGTLGVDSMRQMSQRVRDEIPTHLWVNESPKVQKQVSQGYQELINEIIDYAETNTFGAANIEELTQRITEAYERNKQRIETVTAETIQEIERYEKSNYRTCMVFAFEQAGYNFQEKAVSSNPAVKKQLKDITEEIHRDRARQIFTAPTITESAPEKLPHSEQEKYAKLKASLLRKLPGIEETEIWHEEFIYDVFFKYPNYLRCIDNEFLFNNPLIADALKDKQLRYITTNLLRNHDVSLWEFSQRYELIQGLREVGLERIIDAPEGTQFTYRNKVIQDIYSKLRRRSKLRAKLGIEKVGKYAMREVNRLLRMIGMKFVASWERDGDLPCRVYTLCKENTQLEYKPICYELTRLKWTTWVQNEIANLANSIEKDDENLSIEKIAKLFSLHSLKLVTHTHNNLYNNQALSVIKRHNENKLLKTLKELANKISQIGTSTKQGDESFREEIRINPQEIVKDIADFIDVDWQVFADLLELVGDSVKFQLLGLLQGVSLSKE